MKDGPEEKDDIESVRQMAHECPDFGKEWNLLDLLNCQQDNIPKQMLRARGISSAIDIGCSDTRLLHVLYHMLGIQKCIGVDRMDEHAAIQKLNESLEKSNAPIHDFTSFYDSYVRGYNSIGEYIEKQLSEEDFTKHIIYVKQHTDQVDPPDDNYGLIIMSNVLHYFTMARCATLLHWAKKSVEQGGFLYLRFKEGAEVQQTSWSSTDFSYEEAKAICREVFPHGFSEREDAPNLHASKINEGREFVWTNFSF